MQGIINYAEKWLGNKAIKIKYGVLASQDNNQ